MLKIFQDKQYLKVSEIEDHLNQVIFECIDTSEKWERVEKELAEIEREMEQFYVKIIDENSGEVPKENSFWHLFLGVVSKVLYFKSLAMASLNEGNEKLAPKLKMAMVTAIETLPNKQTEENEEFLNEISNTIRRLFSEEVEIKPTTIKDSLASYKNYLEIKY